MDEVVETGLLPKAIDAWRAGIFFLQRQVHARAPAILLGVAWLDALDLDAEGASRRKAWTS